MKILITGSSGFIGAALSLKLLQAGHKVVGVDNHNDYYDVGLKHDRAKRLLNYPDYTLINANLEDRRILNDVFIRHRPQYAVNLAAQAGVRHSLEKPFSYIDSNIVGFLNILECCRHYGIKHLIYASSSSVYGANGALPFSENEAVSHPLSLYAATKKMNELMAHSYSHLYKIPTTGLRLFTVYGPWGRPDMAIYKFAKAILDEKPIQVFNNGNHLRDFTYIDDVIESIIRVIPSPPSGNTAWNPLRPKLSDSKDPWKIYNIGHSSPVRLENYIAALEKSLKKVAIKEYMPMQPGDVLDTFADSSNFVETFKFESKTSIKDGVLKFAEWFCEYYKPE
jgi:UDP-glucuronate 4-epimerase